MNTYFKFVIEAIVKRMSRSPEEKQMLKQQKAERKQPVLVSLFGMVPFSLGLMFKKRRK
ncbi:YqzE family protein [Fictibacillus sp. WQ 8-8]|uniref:YqzE family protein n=1 Tax=Fictibacillus marinisediminis TaxID=2878389 RepID=A0A9X1XB62_9BACL|nr:MULTISPECIES: YqzE family protein [Fictibacillus]SFD69475.1 YqzE-like protein [Bacillus sp. OV194]MCK6257677.1 YqzE family protein [Fictibacillus marinisediminis]MCQ6266193.1 YqzE family protein [Fictibacillus sp. WQ 8-8]MED2972587.1 YqzE family protein [Fictibacillus sp. B-59209]UZJ80676.1 YqzE family protein [Fictibacillus sp. KU28468]